MFVFREAEHATRFAERLTAADVAFERHEEDGEMMFGVAKTYDRVTIRENNLVHGEFRDPFIPHRGWRWGLLVFTAAVLGLAVLGWLTSTTAHAQPSGLPWELDVVSRVHVPVQALGMEPADGTTQGLTSTWTPRVGTEFGLRIHRRLREGWTLGGGIEWVRREHLVALAYTNDTLGMATVDTLPQLRSLAYRLPVLGGSPDPFGGGTERSCRRAAAWRWKWKTSETIASMLVQTAEDDRVLQAYQGRARFVTVPVLAEIGIQKAAENDKPGWYVGWFWSSPMGRGTWAETTWTSGSVSALSRMWLPQVVTGLDLRLVLPE